MLFYTAMRCNSSKVTVLLRYTKVGLMHTYYWADGIDSDLSPLAVLYDTRDVTAIQSPGSCLQYPNIQLLLFSLCPNPL